MIYKAKMMLMVIYSTFCIMLPLVFVMLMVMSFKLPHSYEKDTTFECGFDSFMSPRLPFCMKFFLLAILFLIFDVEVSLLFPILWSTYMLMSFMLILLGGLLYEWIYGSLNWVS